MMLPFYDLLFIYYLFFFCNANVVKVFFEANRVIRGYAPRLSVLLQMSCQTSTDAAVLSMFQHVFGIW